MSGVRAANMSKEPIAVRPVMGDAGLQAMQDVLYDILANGMDPESCEVPTQEVERFLFEHARSPRSRDEFHSFFAAHGLSVRTHFAPPPAGLVLPPLERPAGREDGGMPVRVPVELAFGNPSLPSLQLDDDASRTGTHA